MHKRISEKLNWAIEQVKKETGEHDLNKIEAKKLIALIGKQNGSFGKMIIRDLNPTDSPIKNISVAKLLEMSANLAYRLNNYHIGTEHLVSCFFRTKTIESPRSAKQSSPPLDNNDEVYLPDKEHPNSGDFIRELNSTIGDLFFENVSSAHSEKNILKNFSTNLNSQTQNHLLIGRKEELERIAYTLGRRMKNNPLLIGEPGVGKTAIIEGLAKKIAQGKVPSFLQGKKILSLDLGLLVAGTNFRGEFEARLKEIITEAKNDSSIILFIDEIHNLIGTGNATGAMDAANLLKPSLSRGEIQLIGATTFDEYQKYIEKDSALERRFQPIIIDEPTVKETRKILLGIKSLYENYHNLIIENDALKITAQLAHQYIRNRFLPDSAIDLVDETAARLRGKFGQLKIYNQLQSHLQRLTKLIERKEKLVLSGHYEKAIAIRNQEKNLTEKIDLLKKEIKQIEQSHPIKLTVQDILNTLAQSVRIPQDFLDQNNYSLAQSIKRTLRKKLVGQTFAKKEIFHTLLRSLSGVSEKHRPLGSFLFIGPTGVGKTLTAKILAQALTPLKDSLIQVNMSELSEKHSTSRLLGSPAGYVGYEESGELSEKIRKNPYSVVLFDEIEKSDPAVHNILLQILEEGQLTDAKGKIINFRNTIIILTSNIGTGQLTKMATLGFSRKKTNSHLKKKLLRENITQQLKEALLPELLGRLDHTLIFDSLTEKEIEKIVAYELQKIVNRLKKKSIQLTFTPSLIKHLSQKSFDPAQGARLVKKQIQQYLEPIIAKKILSKKKVSLIKLSVIKGKIKVL